MDSSINTFARQFDAPKKVNAENYAADFTNDVGYWLLDGLVYCFSFFQYTLKDCFDLGSGKYSERLRAREKEIAGLNETIYPMLHSGEFQGIQMAEHKVSDALTIEVSVDAFIDGGNEKVKVTIGDAWHVFDMSRDEMKEVLERQTVGHRFSQGAMDTY